MKELGVDEKVNRGREVLATTLASGRSNVSTVFNNLSKNVEKFREQRRSQDLANLQTQSQISDETENVGAVTSPAAEKPPTTTPVVAAGTPVLAEASTRAGAYLSSWASWAGEKRKKVFTQTPTASPPPETTGNEKSLPSLPADDPPPKKSFEESIFDARMRAAHAHSSSSSSVFSPQRTNSMSSSIHPATEVKDLDSGKGVGLGIVNLEPQSPLPVPVVVTVKSPRLEGVESVLPSLPIQETDIPPPIPTKDEVTQHPSLIVERSKAPAPSNIEPSQPAVLAVEEAVGILKPEPEIVSPIQPPLSFVRREVTPPMADDGLIQSSVPIEEKVVESSRSEPEGAASWTRRKVPLPEAGVKPIDQPAIVEEAAESPQPERVASSLPLMRRKMTLPKADMVEPIEQFTAVEEKAVESLKSESEIVASPPPSLTRMRKMTLSRADKVKLIEQSALVEENPINSQKPEPERVASPPPSLPFMRRKMTLPRAGKVEPTENFTAVEEKAVESKPDLEIIPSHVPSLSWTKRKMTLPRVEKVEPAGQSTTLKEQAVESPRSDLEGAASPLSSRKRVSVPQADVFGSTQPSTSVEEKTVESQNPETERVATPPPSLSFTRRRKMTIQRSEIVEPSRHFESVMEKAVQPLKPEQERTKSPPSVEKAEDPLRQGRFVQPRSFGPAVGQTEVTMVPELTERNRRSIPTFDKSQTKPPRPERTPEPVKIPEYTKAAPLEVKSAQEKTTEPIRVSRHSRAESAATSTGQPAPRPLRRAETQSAAMISSKPSGESPTTAKHSRSESSSSITSIDNNKPVPKTERVKGSIAERAKRFSQTQDEPSDNDNVSPARAAFAARRAMFEKK